MDEFSAAIHAMEQPMSTSIVWSKTEEEEWEDLNITHDDIETTHHART